MSLPIRRVAVLGAGTMGSQIAAHMANAATPCFLLDRVPEELSAEELRNGMTLAQPSVRNRLARAGLAFALKTTPAALFTPSLADTIQLGNFDDDLSRLQECDWVIEAVVEHLAAKQQLWARVLPHLRP